MKFKVGDKVRTFEGKCFTISNITEFTEAEYKLCNTSSVKLYWYWDGRYVYQFDNLEKLTPLELAML